MKERDSKREGERQKRESHSNRDGVGESKEVEGGGAKHRHGGGGGGMMPGGAYWPLPTYPCPFLEPFSGMCCI